MSKISDIVQSGSSFWASGTSDGAIASLRISSKSAAATLILKRNSIGASKEPKLCGLSCLIKSFN